MNLNKQILLNNFRETETIVANITISLKPPKVCRWKKYFVEDDSKVIFFYRWNLLQIFLYLQKKSYFLSYFCRRQKNITDWVYAPDNILQKCNFYFYFTFRKCKIGGTQWYAYCINSSFLNLGPNYLLIHLLSMFKNYMIILQR